MIRLGRAAAIPLGLLASGALFLAGCGSIATVSPPSSSAKVAVSIHLNRTTLQPGLTDRGVVIITNHSGRVLLIHDCRNRGGLVAGLTSSRVAYFVGPPLRGCHLIRTVGPGVTNFPTWISTTYQNCDTPRMPACNGLGPIELPAGKYQVRFPLAGLPRTTVVVSPAVKVLPPAWLTSLHGSQGSLLIAASPCVGTLMTANTKLPGVKVVVIGQGHLVARRASSSGGASFTLALAPGRYVVRTDAHKRAVVTVSTGRQTIANVNAICF